MYWNVQSDISLIIKLEAVFLIVLLILITLHNGKVEHVSLYALKRLLPNIMLTTLQELVLMIVFPQIMLLIEIQY